LVREGPRKKERKQEIARLVGSGLSHLDVGRELGINRHLVTYLIQI
jgi:DNA-binding CsgD family transcriptional regulator